MGSGIDPHATEDRGSDSQGVVNRGIFFSDLRLTALCHNVLVCIHHGNRLEDAACELVRKLVLGIIGDRLERKLMLQ